MPHLLHHLQLICRVNPSKDLASLRKKLQQAGFRLEVSVLESPELCTPEWAKEHLGAGIKGVILLEEEANYVRSVRERLLALGPAFRFVPVFYGYSTSKQLVDLEKSPSPRLSDFFALTANASHLRLRLNLRIAEATEKATVHRTAQEQSSKLAALDTALKQREEFLSMCSHDLRSPLALIQTCLSMVLKSPESMAALSPMFGELLTRAHRQSGHALTLVKDLLDVTALEQGLKPHYQVLRLHDLLNEFFVDYRLQAQQKAVDFHYSNPVQDWKVLADSDRIRQLLQNLFSNALKFSQPGKNIYLNVAPFQGRRSHDPSYPMIVISLKDEGKGIPHAEMVKIFDRFVQLKEQSREGGRGLGLTVAKQISTLHDGNIWVESEEGKGSTFFVLFPHTLSRTAVRERSAIRRILVAEPSTERRKAIFGKLIDWGYQVDFAVDGVEAITLAHHLGPDAILLTPELGKIGAAEVSNLLKSEADLKDIPVILAAFGSKHQNQRNETVLADAVLPMPFNEKDWETVLARCQKVPFRKAA